MHVRRFYGSRLVGLITISLSLLCNSTPSGSAQPASHPPLDALINKFFDAYQRKSLGELMSLWSARSPDLAAQQRAMQQTFADARVLALETLAFKSIAVDGDKADVRVAARMRTVEMQKAGAASHPLRLNRIFRCVREGASWKIWSYLPSEDELAAALADAGTEEERQALLARDREMVTPELQRSLVAQGDRLFRLGSYPQALVMYRLASVVADQHGDLRGKAVALRGMGTIHHYRGDHKEALRRYRESLRLAEAARSEEEKGRALNNIGNVFFARGRYAEARGYYEESLRLAEAAGNKAEIARALNNLGNIYASQDDYTRALESYKKSMTLKDELGDQGGVSIALYNMGKALYGLGNYTRALEHYAGSLKITEALGRKAGVASTLRAIGDIHQAQGNGVQALVNYSRSLTLTRELEDRAGTAATLNSIGRSLYSAGRYAEASEYYHGALKLAQEFADQKELVRTVNNIALLCQSQRDYVRALEYYRKALGLVERTGRTPEVVYAQRSVGNIYRLLGDDARALEAYQRGLKLAEESGHMGAAASLEKEIGIIHYSQGRYTKAIETSSRATRRAGRAGEPQVYSDARLTSGKAYRALGRFELARQAFADAIRNLEQPRREISAGGQEPQTLRDGLAPYHAMIALLVAQNRPAEAFGYAEMAKGRVLSHVLRGGAADVTTGMSHEERGQEQAYTEEIASLRSQIHYAKTKQSSDKAHLSDLDARLRAVRRKYHEFESRLYGAHPQLKVNRGEVRPPASNEATLMSPDAQTALLEFVVTEERTYLFVLTRGELKVYPVETSREELAHRVGNLRKNLIERKSDFGLLAGQLYDLLLRPAGRQLDGKSILCIVPDDVLWQLPFNALQSKEDRYLVEDRAVFYTTSLALLHGAGGIPRRRPPDGTSASGRLPSPNALLAFANPAPDKAVEETIKLLYGEESFSTAEREREVNALGSLYSNGQSRSYTGAQAHEGRVKDEAGKYRMLHFATFGVIDNSSPMNSYVLLSRTESDTIEDGLLTATELLQLNLQADITVLSASQHSGAQAAGGEGVIALSWALGVAGCPNLVISQWGTDSAGTTEFMLELHRNMNFEKLNSEGVWLGAKAMRSVELKMLASKTYRHPYYWSRFMLVSRG